MKKYFSIGLLLIITAVSLAGCKTPQSKVNEIDPETITEANSKMVTFTDTKGQYTLTYPGIYDKNDLSTDSQIFRIFKKNDNEYFYVRVKKVEKETEFYRDTESTKTAKIGGFDAKVFELPEGYCDGPECTDPFIAVIVFNDLTEYIFEFYNINELGETEEAILASFKVMQLR